MATSTVTGAEGLIRATRTAMTQDINIQDPEQRQETLMTVLKDLSSILSDNLHDDRYAIPAVEFLAFLIDGYIPSIPEGTVSRYALSLSPRKNMANLSSFRRLFVLVQKAHFKSSNISRLEAAIKAYSSLSRFEPLRGEVLKKLTSMLLHPFPRVCLYTSFPPPSHLWNRH